MDEEPTLFQMRTTHLSDEERNALIDFLNGDTSDSNFKEMEYWLALRSSHQLDILEDWDDDDI